MTNNLIKHAETMKHVLEGNISMPLAVNTQDVLVKYTSYLYPPITSKYDYDHDTTKKTYQTQSLLINNEARTRFIADVNKNTRFYEA